MARQRLPELQPEPTAPRLTTGLMNGSRRPTALIAFGSCFLSVSFALLSWTATVVWGLAAPFTSACFGACFNGTFTAVLGASFTGTFTATFGASFAGAFPRTAGAGLAATTAIFAGATPGFAVTATGFEATGLKVLACGCIGDAVTAT